MDFDEKSLNKVFYEVEKIFLGIPINYVKIVHLFPISLTEFLEQIIQKVCFRLQWIDIDKTRYVYLELRLY